MVRRESLRRPQMMVHETPRPAPTPPRKEHMPDELPAVEYAKTQLATHGVMTPEDLLDEMETGPALVFLRDAIVMVTAILAGSVTDAEAPPEEAEQAFSGAAQGLALALTGITHAMVELRILPTEALEALESANASTNPKGA